MMKKAVLVLAAAALIVASCRRAPDKLGTARFEQSPVIIISVDTLRSDRLPVYGYKGVQTPNIDAFRADAILFEKAYAHVPLTLPSHVSLLTGELPAETGVRNNIGYVFDSAKQPTIPGLLKAKGYATGAAVSAWVLRGDSGLQSAFDFYDDRIVMKSNEVAGRLQRPGGETLDVAERWIGGNAAKPFFFMLHLFEPHSPYEAPEPFRTQHAAEPYDGEVAETDALVGRFLDFLRKESLYDKATIIFLSDHGEGLMDHGEQEHGVFLYREAIQVPLIVKLPGGRAAGTSVSVPVQLIDVMPTIAQIAGAERDPRWKGTSLLEIAGADTPPVRRVFSETLYPRLHLGWSDLRSLVDDRHHFIEAPRPELYDLARDPGEKSNVLATERRAYAAMREAMRGYEKKLAAPTQVNPEEAKKLQALGYLGSTAIVDDSAELPDPKDGLEDLARVERANARAARGETREAIRDLEEVIQRNPRFTDAIVRLASIYDDIADYPNAIRTYRRAIEANPSNAAGPASALGWIYLKTHQLDEAEEHAKLALPVYPAYATLLLGRIALARGDLQNAAKYAREAANDENYRVASTVLLAQAMTRGGGAAQALPQLDALKADLARRGLPPEPMLEFARGDALARMSRFAEAEQAFAEEARVFPKDRETYAHLAVVCLLQGKRAEANRAMEAMVKRIPGRESYEFAAKAFAQMGDERGAAEWRRRGAAAN